MKLGDIVYQKRQGFSGVPMKIVELRGSEARCIGAKGWQAVGSKPGDSKWFSLANLTVVPDSAWK